MKNRLFFRELTLLLFVVFLVSSCTDEIDRPVFPISATIFHSVAGKQVAFTALTHSAVSWSWDFGDGQTGTEQNPVHVYEQGGYYKAILTAKDDAGGTASDTVNLALDLSAINYLTGNQNAPGYKGKTWKISASHSPYDILANSDANLSLFDPSITSLPAGTFSAYLGLPETYDDEFTFFYDGKYTQDTKDGTACGGIVYAMVMQQLGITTITKTGGKAVFGQDAFALTRYTPDPQATFLLTEKEDFTIPTAPDFATGVVPPGIPVVTYKNVMTIDFPNSNEFVGLRDFQRKVIVQDINDKTMRLVIFLTMSPDAIVSQDPLIVLSTSAMVLTFVAVK
jgi:hypothetical protein